MALRSSCKARVQQRSVNPCPTTRGRLSEVAHTTRNRSNDSSVINVLGSTFLVAASNLQAYLLSPMLSGNFRAIQKQQNNLQMNVSPQSRRENGTSPARTSPSPLRDMESSNGTYMTSTNGGGLPNGEQTPRLHCSLAYVTCIK